MLCILPATRLALEGWPAKDVPDASGLFNLMRNLGGAIGIALIDTLVQSRTAGHAEALGAGFRRATPPRPGWSAFPPACSTAMTMGPVDAITSAIVAPMMERAALTQSLNEGWMHARGAVRAGAC